MEIIYTGKGSQTFTLEKDYNNIIIFTSSYARHESGSGSISFTCLYKGENITNNDSNKIYLSVGGNGYNRGGSAAWTIYNPKKDDIITITNTIKSEGVSGSSLIVLGFV